MISTDNPWVVATVGFGVLSVIQTVRIWIIKRRNGIVYRLLDALETAMIEMGKMHKRTVNMFSDLMDSEEEDDNP